MEKHNVLLDEALRYAARRWPIFPCGSNGLLATSDGALVLMRRRKTNETVLSVTGRDIKGQELAMHFDESTCQ